MILEEQTIARSFPSQAIPMFLLSRKLKSLCSHLRNLVIAPHAKASTRYILVRDLAFFSLDFFSGDRGSDLGRLKSSDVLRPPDGKGYLFDKPSVRENLTRRSNNVFAIKPIPNSPYCPVSNLDFYLSLVKMMNIDLNPGYLFRVLDHHGNILSSPFERSAVENRLKKHPRDSKLDRAETMHSFRSGCSITLSLLGVPYNEVAKLVGWKSVKMVSHYCRFDSVMSNEDASSVFCEAARPGTSAPSFAENLGKLFRQRNNLKGYKPLFT